MTIPKPIVVLVAFIAGAGSSYIFSHRAPDIRAPQDAVSVTPARVLEPLTPPGTPAPTLQVSSEIDRLEKLKREIYGNKEYLLVPRSAVSSMLISPINGLELSGDFIVLAGLKANEVSAANYVLGQARQELDRERAKSAKVTRENDTFVIRIEPAASYGRSVESKLMSELQGVLPGGTFDMFTLLNRNSLSQVFDHFMMYREEREISPMPGQPGLYVARISLFGANNEIQGATTLQYSKDQLITELQRLKYSTGNLN